MSDDAAKPGADYTVGYGKPPKDSQFKPGQSGNPKGRPRRSKSIDALIRDELGRKVRLQEGGREIHITKREAIIKQLVNKAIKGDARATQMMMLLIEKLREPEPFESTTADDLELLHFLSRSAKSKSQES